MKRQAAESTFVRFLEQASFAMGFVIEAWALFHALSAATYSEGAFYFGMATYVAVFAVAWRQIANGHTLFPRRDAAPSENAP